MEREQTAHLEVANYPVIQVTGAIWVGDAAATLIVDLSELPRARRGDVLMFLSRHFPVRIVTRYGEAIPPPAGRQRAERQGWWLKELVLRLFGR